MVTLVELTTKGCCINSLVAKHPQRRNLWSGRHRFSCIGSHELDLCLFTSADDSGEILTSAPSSDVSRLPQILDLTQASILREQMKALIGFGAIRLDAADVLSMSTPCIQILLATGYAAESFGATLQIVNASAAFEVAVTDLGLQSHFNHWMA